MSFLPSRSATISFSKALVSAIALHLRATTVRGGCPLSLPKSAPGEKHVLSVKSSNCAAVVNICGGSCWLDGGGIMPGPRGGMGAPPCCGGGASWFWRLRCSILIGGVVSKMKSVSGLVIGVEANPLRVVAYEGG